MTLSFFTDAPPPVQCSRAQCQQPATVEIRWRNPKIHDESRTKTWLACGDHESYLTEFLRARSFPVTVVPYGAQEGDA